MVGRPLVRRATLQDGMNPVNRHNNDTTSPRSITDSSGKASNPSGEGSTASTESVSPMTASTRRRLFHREKTDGDVPDEKDKDIQLQFREVKDLTESEATERTPSSRRRAHLDDSLKESGKERTGSRQGLRKSNSEKHDHRHKSISKV